MKSKAGFPAIFSIEMHTHKHDDFAFHSAPVQTAGIAVGVLNTPSQAITLLKKAGCAE
jgi:hypothetical protein